MLRRLTSLLAILWALLLLLQTKNNTLSPLHAKATYRTSNGRKVYFVLADDRFDLLSPLQFKPRLYRHNIALQHEAYRGGTLWKFWKMYRWIASAAAIDIVVFTDSDVIFGGCALEDFVASYDAIVNATGCPIVASAEAQCYKPGRPSKRLQRCARYENPPFPERMAATPGGPIPPVFRTEGTSIARRKCFVQEEGGPPFPAGCARYAFVNSGAYMGPPAALLSMLRWTLAYACLDLVPNLWEWSWAQLQGRPYFLPINDQTALGEYMFAHHEMLTLDYGARLFVTGWNLDPAMFVYGAPSGVLLREGKGRHRKMCFLHDNGHTLDAKNAIEKALAGAAESHAAAAPARSHWRHKNGTKDMHDARRAAPSPQRARPSPPRPVMSTGDWLGLEAVEALVIASIVIAKAWVLVAVFRCGARR